MVKRAGKETGALEAWRKTVEEGYGAERAAALERGFAKDAEFVCRVGRTAPTASWAESERPFFGQSCFIKHGRYRSTGAEAGEGAEGREGGEGFEGCQGSRGTEEKCYFLDPASVLPVAALAVEPCHRVLDLCAAPGGKSLLLLSQLRPLHSPPLQSASPIEASSAGAAVGCLVANEPCAARCERLRSNLATHAPHHRTISRVVKSNPATSRWPCALATHGPFDRILVDAPCSSDRHRYLVDRATTTSSSPNQPCRLSDPAPDPSQTLASYKPSAVAKVQLQLLQRAAQLLKLGGRIVYSTCALSSKENDGVVSKALKTKGSGLSQLPHSEVFRQLHFVLPHTQIQFSDISGSGEPSEVELGDRCAVNRDNVLRLVLERTDRGYLILPDRNAGIGPIYIAVLEKLT